MSSQLAMRIVSDQPSFHRSSRRIRTLVVALLCFRSTQSLNTMPSATPIEQGLFRCTLCGTSGGGGGGHEQQQRQDCSFASRNQLFEHLRNKHGFQRELVSSSDTPTNHPSAAQDRSATAEAVRSTYSNPHHEAYYRLQSHAGLLPLDDWETASATFKRPLNVAFRVSPTVTGARREALERLERRVGDETLGGSSPFFSATSCRVVERPLREWPTDAQQLLIDGQELGVVNRQELCSMVPPLLLLSSSNPPEDKNPDKPTRHKREHPTVLDLCAAPGSKTLQLMDLLNDRYRPPRDDTPKPDSADTCDVGGGYQGMLVANDSNRSRLLTVARRARMMGGTGAPASATRTPSHKKQSLLLNASDGRYFPALRKWAGYKLKFDYILADVPCSGDGTLRKLSNKEWQRWNVKQHLTLHKLQLRLLQRSLQLVKKGGRVVYSTCSLDPIENEAVVSAAIANLGGPTVYRIVKAPQYLEEGATQPFPYTQGSDHWIVPHPKFDSIENQHVVFESFQDVPEELRQKDIQATMFPPSNDEDMKKSLKNCCRILPQHLDSGGFFCAIIERVPPAFFAVCCPSLRRCTSGHYLVDSADSVHHGRIYSFPDDHDDAYDISPVKRLRSVLRTEKQQRILEGEDPEKLEFYFEGLPTIQTAQNWLRQHGAFVAGRSETVSVFPDITVSDTDVHLSAKWYNQTDDEKKTIAPNYIPLVAAPHPDLVAEFVDFFGMYTQTDEAKKAGVQRFPVEELVTVGGGEKAGQVTTNVMGTATSKSTENPTTKPRFLQLTLVSKEIRTIFSGGACFNPMELGLLVCWVPIGPVSESLLLDLRDKSAANRALKNSRYGLTDEAAELIGRCASKRVLRLSAEYVLMLLTTGRIGDADSSFPELAGESSGSIIVVFCSSTIETEIFLSCTFNQDSGSLALLTDRRASSAWLRLLQTAMR